MKKILFALLFISMAFSQIDNTIAGWYNDNYYVPSGSVYSEGLIVADESTLAAETLDDVDFASNANWGDTGDFTYDAGVNFEFVWTAWQTSELEQLDADFLVVAVGSRWYKFTYTLAVATAFDGDGALTITTAFALTAVNLNLLAGTHTVYFKSAVTPTDFVITVVSGTDTEGTFTIDDVTLKEITGGNIEVYGLYTGGGSTGLKIDSDGVARLPKAIFLDEKASQETIVAGEGQYWVLDTAPTTPMFTDDDGDDHEFTLGGSYFGEMEAHESGNTLTIGITMQDYGVQGEASAGDLDGFTFVSGSTGPIASISTVAAGDSTNYTDVGHGLLTGDYVTINTVNHVGITVVVREDADNFRTGIDFVGDETGFWFEGDYLLASAGTMGRFFIFMSMSFSAGNPTKEYHAHTVQNATRLDGMSIVETVVGTNHSKGADSAYITVNAGDRFWLVVENETDSENLEYEDLTLLLHKIGE